MRAAIIPTIFVTEEQALKERFELYEGLVERVQLDVADEEFTTEPTLTVKEFISQPTILRRDLHLMVGEPIRLLTDCVKEDVGVIAGQIELMGSQKEFVEEARRRRLKVGLAIDLETKLTELDWSVGETVDQLLVMTVRAGKETQAFEKEGLEKVKSLRDKGFKGEICVDGGVNEETIKLCVQAGADLLAVGSSLWKADKVELKLKELEKLARKAMKG